MFEGYFANSKIISDINWNLSTVLKTIIKKRKILNSTKKVWNKNILAMIILYD